MTGGALQYADDSERQVFEELFDINFILLSEFLLEICWEEVTEEMLKMSDLEFKPGPHV